MGEVTGQGDERSWRSADSAGAIYGTVAAMAVIAGSARKTGTREVLVLTVGTLFVFWVTHVYADALEHHLRHARRLDHRAIRAAMGAEWPLITGPAPSLVCLALGALGLFKHEFTIRLALWVGVTQLFCWGIAFARRQRWNWPVAMTAGVANALCGVAIVLLELLVH
jgi:hypothetical protein